MNTGSDYLDHVRCVKIDMQLADKMEVLLRQLSESCKGDLLTLHDLGLNQAAKKCADHLDERLERERYDPC